jgi:hypothetical protein
MGEWMYRPRFSWPRHKLEVSGQLHAPAALPPGKKPQYPLDRWLGGPQSRSGNMEKWKFLPLPGPELRPPGRPARSHSLYRLRYPGSCMDCPVAFIFSYILWGSSWGASKVFLLIRQEVGHVFPPHSGSSSCGRRKRLPYMDIRKCWISGLEQPTDGGRPAWGLRGEENLLVTWHYTGPRTMFLDPRGQLDWGISKTWC